MSEVMNNATAFEALLENIRRASNNVKRDAGTRFETLIKDWLTQDQPYCDLFSKVETFEEWASSHPELTENGKQLLRTILTLLLQSNASFTTRIL